RRILDCLVTHHYLSWHPSGWVADMDRIRGLRIPGGSATSMLMEKVEALAPEHRAMLEAAAVLGETADLELITQVVTLSREDDEGPLRRDVGPGEILRGAQDDERAYAIV